MCFGAQYYWLGFILFIYLFIFNNKQCPDSLLVDSVDFVDFVGAADLFLKNRKEEIK